MVLAGLLQVGAGAVVTFPLRARFPTRRRPGTSTSLFHVKQNAPARQRSALNVLGAVSMIHRSRPEAASSHIAAAKHPHDGSHSSSYELGRAHASEGVASVRRVLLFHVKRARFSSAAAERQRIGCGELS